MTKFEQHLTEAAQGVVLDVDDKALMRERLVSYMEHKPLRHGNPRAHAAPTPSWFGFFRAHHLTGALLIALIATSSTFGVSSAADDALPGDLLYTVKVNVNEELKTVFLNTDEQRLDWERERAELRLKEASQLAAEGRFDTKKQQAVARLFAEHTEAVVEQVHAVEVHDPVLAAEVSTDFEAALDTHEAVLARLIVEQEEDTDVVDEGARELVGAVRTAALEAGKIADEAEEEVLATVEETEEEETQRTADETENNTPGTESANMRVRAAYRSQARAAEDLAYVEELLQTLEGHDKLVAQAQAQVDSAKQHMAAGEQAFEENNLSAAYANNRRASTAFQKVGQYLEVADLFDVQLYVEEGVDAEEQLDSTPVLESDAVVPTAPAAEEALEEETPLYEHARDDAAAHIGEAQRILLTHEGYEENTAKEANDLIKDAIAYTMRGDIALVLDDEAGALERFGTAAKHARRAIEILERAVESGTVIDVYNGDDRADNDTAEVATGTDETVLPLTMQQRYEVDAHIFTGSLELPSACASVETAAEIVSREPEQLALALQVVEAPEGEECTQTDMTRPFSVTVHSNPEAVLTEVTVNELPVEWVLSGE